MGLAIYGLKCWTKGVTNPGFSICGLNIYGHEYKSGLHRQDELKLCWSSTFVHMSQAIWKAFYSLLYSCWVKNKNKTFDVCNKDSTSVKHGIKLALLGLLWQTEGDILNSRPSSVPQSTIKSALIYRDI